MGLGHPYLEPTSMGGISSRRRRGVPEKPVRSDHRSAPNPASSLLFRERPFSRLSLPFECRTLSWNAGDVDLLQIFRPATQHTHCPPCPPAAPAPQSNAIAVLQYLQMRPIIVAQAPRNLVTGPIVLRGAGHPSFHANPKLECRRPRLRTRSIRQEFHLAHSHQYGRLSRSIDRQFAAVLSEAGTGAPL